jgi:hypothetical protein
LYFTDFVLMLGAKIKQKKYEFLKKFNFY